MLAKECNLFDNFAIILQNCRMWIARTLESVVSKFKEQFPVVIITGARQVGKTSLLTHLYPTTNYITLDDPMQLSLAQNAPDEFLSRIESPVIID